MSVSTTGSDGASNAAVVQATFAATLVDEWLRCGVDQAVICPGSRSTPLALALASAEAMTCHIRLDERSAGFFALGLALELGRAVVICTTSGTAAAELHAAVVEAHHSRVPLVVCTADRPPDLHHVGAPQTIDQTNLYGNSVRWFCAPGVPQASAADTWCPLAARSVAEAAAGPFGPGPVHLNLAFAEPLVAQPGPLPVARADGGPAVAVRGDTGVATADLGYVAGWAGRRGVIVAGAGAGDPDLVLDLAEALDWPVLADPRSGVRRSHRAVVSSADAILRGGGDRLDLRAEVIVMLGAPWVSKALGAYVAQHRHAASVVAVDPWWRWRDPDRAVGTVYRTDPDAWLCAAREAVGATTISGEWLGRWQAAEELANGAIDTVLGDQGAALSEPGLARSLYAMLAPGVRLVLASSMPVRELEWFAPRVAEPPVVYANRGANGIDGVSSTALGVAAAGEAPVVAVVGDLAFLHDLSALVLPASAVGSPASCTLVVVDNGGGGIFNFLPQAELLDGAQFEELFATPQAPRIDAVARGMGLPVASVQSPGELAEALASFVGQVPLGVVHARVLDRAANVSLHDRLHQAVAVALHELVVPE